MTKLKDLLKLADELLVADYYNGVHSTHRHRHNFAGSTPGWADIMVWPFLERLPIIDRVHAQAGIVAHIEVSVCTHARVHTCR